MQRTDSASCEPVTAGLHHLDEVSATAAAGQALSGRLALLAVVDEALNPLDTTVRLFAVAVSVESSSLPERTGASFQHTTKPASGDGLSDHDTTVALEDGPLVGDESRRGVLAAVVDAEFGAKDIFDELQVDVSTTADRVCNRVTRCDGDIGVAECSADNRRHLDVPVNELLGSVHNDRPGPAAAGLAFLERHILFRDLNLLHIVGGVPHLGPGRVKGWGLGRDSKSLQLGFVFIQGQVLGCMNVSTVDPLSDNTTAGALWWLD
jgi:hypothetical protein